MNLRLCLCLAALALLPSCAYVQTHKNVRELGRRFPGYQLEKPTQLLRAQGTWYVQATPASYRKSHDIVHDNVFRKTNAPTMRLQETGSGSHFHAISADTAAVLLRPDGYAETQTLAREIATSPAPWLTTLPGASTHAIRADLAGEHSTPITYASQPAEAPLAYRVLSGIDFLVVDVPGTVVYNVAVPLIAPFVFFYEFLSE